MMNISQDKKLKIRSEPGVCIYQDWYSNYIFETDRYELYFDDFIRYCVYINDLKAQKTYTFENDSLPEFLQEYSFTPPKTGDQLDHDIDRFLNLKAFL